MKGPIFLILSGLLVTQATPLVLADSQDQLVWENLLRQQYFAGREIDTLNPVVKLELPARAEDPAMVPVRITSLIEQTPERYIREITLLVDDNPEPLSGRFRFTPASGKADLALRMRVNSYTFVRAIAEMNDGTLSMHKVYVKASGGCSAPVGADLEAAMARLGKMRLRVLDDELAVKEPTLTQLMVSHPNLSGMQMDQVTRMYKPAHFINHMNISFNDEPVLTADLGIAISSDPNFRFYFVPGSGSGVLKAEVTDNKGNSFTQSYTVTP